MNQHWWQGQWIPSEELNKKLINLSTFVEEALISDFDINHFYQCCDLFSEELKHNTLLRTKLMNILVSSNETSSAEAQEVILSISNFLSETELRKKMARELGKDNPFLSSRVNYEEEIFESYRPLGFLVQIMPSNDPALPVLSALEGLLTGNVNLLKISQHSSDFTAELFDSFFQMPLAKRYQKRLIIAKISSSEKQKLSDIFSQADGVVAWGGEEAISQIKQLCPANVNFIEWGHRISFAFVSEKRKFEDSEYINLVKDILIYNQQACSSPQCVYVEEASFAELKIIGNKINELMAKLASKYNLTTPSPMESAEIRKTTLVLETEKSWQDSYSDVIEDQQNRWRILIDTRSGLRASPLYRTIWLKPLKRSEIWKTLHPLRQYLQTVGLACDMEELNDLSQIFYKSGVTRVRALGEMQSSYTGEPHDGYLALTRYLKKVSLQSQDLRLKNFATLDDLSSVKLDFPKWPDKIMGKLDFQNLKAPKKTELFFKSGGSSGEPKISYFTYHDYHRQMDLAAKGLVAAGLNPAKDRCMNLFFGGGLYGGFLSFYTILEKLQAIQLPMSAHMDYEFVGQMIVRNQVNVLLGMPSYLLLMLEANKDLFLKNPVIEKIYFGGEHFSEKQKERLTQEFGISVIRSASYGSVDMGPLGYQCLESPARVHHLHQSIHHLEILKLDQDEPITQDEVGRLVFSTLSRQGLQLLRYDIGDVGRWVLEPCPCGRKSPRFELLGRSGDIFRASGCFYSFSKFQQILSDKLEYDREFQIIIDNEEGIDRLTFILDKESGLSRDKVFKTFIGNYKDLDETVHEEEAMYLNFEFVDRQDFLRSQASGKLIHVTDKRIR
ncbi:MAG: hypothetical protein KDD45_05755 [Bdellovibrionales bacterium]|nr:hypothetical protein [Bdellovibrionales bacterium]